MIAVGATIRECSRRVAPSPRFERRVRSKALTVEPLPKEDDHEISQKGVRGSAADGDVDLRVRRPRFGGRQRPVQRNQQLCRINIFNDSKLYWSSSGYFPFGFLSHSPDLYGLDGTVDSSGAWTYDSQYGSLETIAPVPAEYVSGGNAVSMQPQISASTTTASFDPRAGYGTVSVTLRMRLNLYWTGQSQSCVTSYFNVTVTTGKSCTWCSSPALYNYDSNGSFKAVAQDFTIPALTAGCDTQANRSQFNTDFVFDGSTNHGMIVYGRMNTPSVLTGS
jgi:hypothetical protein